MNTYEIIAVIGVIVGVCGSLGFVFPCLKKKGINAGTVLQEVETGLQEAGTFIQTAEKLVPSKALNILDIVDKLAIKATKAAQQLAISSQLPLEQRRERAKESIKQGLTAFKIPVNSELEKVIDDTIQEMVFDSKTPDEQRNQCQSTLAQQNIQLQSQITQQQATISILQTQNAGLQQRINTIQNAAQTGQNTTTQPVQ